MVARPPLPSPALVRLSLIGWSLLVASLPGLTLSQTDLPAGDRAASATVAAPSGKATSLRGERLLADYFSRETERLAADSSPTVEPPSDAPDKLRGRGPTVVSESLEEWLAQRETLRAQLFEMLGLDPLPEKTPLNPVITGRVEREDFIVENLHFQSRPGLYVTGNLYLPRDVTEPLPAILYVCGHGNVKRDGISYGSKAHYQHHGAWFARNGYACLVIDTLQLAEIEGIHHGTYRYDRWWWLNRGYTPAGVEAWNCIRALDYLETRPEVDMTRVGVTGRSGGGAYSWWIAALDERIAAAVPVAGTTDLENHVVDGVVEGHCDCMYLVNTYRWDYPQIAALVAPRPLLLSNTDRDRIFPLEGVLRTHRYVREIYRLYDAEEKFALQITAGPHSDTQELHLHAFRWFNQHLRDDLTPIDKVATRFLTPEELKVFDELPADELNTTIDQHFVARAPDLVPPSDSQQWNQWETEWREMLQLKTFGSWPAGRHDPKLRLVATAEDDQLRVRAYEFTSQEGIVLPLVIVHHADLKQPESVVLTVANEPQWNALSSLLGDRFGDDLQPVLETWQAEPTEGTLSPAGLELQSWSQQLESLPTVMAFTVPRGVGPTAFPGDARKQIQLRRRFYLLGQTLEGMQVWDTRQATRAVRSISDLAGTSLQLAAEGPLASVALYASLFEDGIQRLDLHELPASHDAGPYLLNVQRFLDMPHAVAMAMQRCEVAVYGDAEPWKAVVATRQALGLPGERFQIHPPLDKVPSGEEQ